MIEEPQYVRDAREQLATFNKSFQLLTAAASQTHTSDKELVARVADLERRLSETEQRAVEAERLAAELKEKAERGERLDQAAGKLIRAIEGLPTTMDEATAIPSAVNPGLDLYGTYEWQQLVEARFYLEQELKERRSL